MRYSGESKKTGPALANIIRDMMKAIASIGAIILLIVLIVGGGCGWAAARVARAVLNGQPAAPNLTVFKWCFGGLPLVDQIDKFLGDKTYVVMLQNNTELRASGGFMGSYAKLKTQDSKLKTMEVEDIYQPDGQLVGYVEPPAPIKKAFPFGSWKLRDANWDVDFSVAGEQIAWFLEQGGEKKIDGVVAVNLSLVNRILEIFGGVKTVTYDEQVTAQNLANLAQTYSEVNKEKRDFLGAVGAALFERIKQSNLTEQMKLIKLIYEQLQKGQILIWMRDGELAASVQRLGWGGTLGNYAGDYLYIVEANLGANKANCCVTRSVTQTVDSLSQSLREKVSIRWENSSQFENPHPPVFWGGNYINYVRVVLPSRVSEISVVSGLSRVSFDEEERGTLPAGRQGFKILGFWVTVPAGGSAVAELEYKSVRAGEREILVRRQPGIDSFPYKLVVDGKVVVSDTIDRDKEYTWIR